MKECPQGSCGVAEKLDWPLDPVDVKRARSGTVREEDDDVVERYLLDIKQRAIDVVGARLGRTVTLAAVTLGLDLAARRGGIGGFDAYGVNA